MGDTRGGTILQVRHALTFDNWIGFIGPVALALAITAWRVWRHISGAKDREEWRQWQKQICESFEQAQQELESIRAEQRNQGEKIDNIGAEVQTMKGRFKQMDAFDGRGGRY